MNIHTRPIVTPQAEETLEDLADLLAIPESTYEKAERSYKSLGEFLNRPTSSIRRPLKSRPEYAVAASKRNAFLQENFGKGGMPAFVVTAVSATAR